MIHGSVELKRLISKSDLKNRTLAFQHCSRPAERPLSQEAARSRTNKNNNTAGWRRDRKFQFSRSHCTVALSFGVCFFFCVKVTKANGKWQKQSALKTPDDARQNS